MGTNIDDGRMWTSRVICLQATNAGVTTENARQKLELTLYLKTEKLVKKSKNEY